MAWKGDADKVAGEKVAEEEEAADSGANEQQEDNSKADESVALPANKRNRPHVAGWSSGVAAAASVEARAPAPVVIQEPNLPAAAAVAGGGGGGGQLPWPCSICGKLFHSRKTFFRHLRVHPEKTYKGAIPPPTFNPERSPESQAEAVVLDVPLGEQVPNQDEASGSNKEIIDLNFPPKEDDEDSIC